jgi:hypothetical protein
MNACIHKGFFIKGYLANAKHEQKILARKDFANDWTNKEAT